MTVLNVTDPTARKPHVCDECGRTIAPGETYHRVESIASWGMSTWKACLQCFLLCRDLWDADVRGEDEYGCETYAYLPEVDWSDVESWSPLWSLRVERFRRRWGGLPYPEEQGDGE